MGRLPERYILNGLMHEQSEEHLCRAGRRGVVFEVCVRRVVEQVVHEPL